MSDSVSDAAGAGLGIDLSQFHQIFFEEASEHLGDLEQHLLSLDSESADDEALDAIFRCAHSIKGGAATFGFSDIAELTHEMESLLDKLRRRELPPTAVMVDLLLQAGDVLKAQLGQHQDGGSGAAIDTAAVIETLRRLQAGDEATAAQEPAPTAAGPAAEAATLRVSVEKVDQLINLVGELVITQAMLAQTGAGVDPTIHRQLAQGLADLERNTRDLQASVMSIRMIPLSAVFNRFPRMLRDLAAKLDKKVAFVTHGEATELDKGMVEKITDPLTHLVRNSCDHGIEQPAERLAAGKPETGTITLSASQQGGSLVIEVRDDGRGLSRETLLRKARDKGIQAPDGMSDAEVWDLIFAPGFSTNEVVSAISGRGVGMDVVKRNITALGGCVEIDSEEGAGMSVRVRLPLTLAIMDSMSVRVDSECYILPLASVVESFQFSADRIRTIGGDAQLVQVREQYLPVVRLDRIFQVPRERPEPDKPILVVVEANGKRLALLVDELLGQQQVVVKNLGSNDGKVDKAAGATIVGDGRVAQILDVDSLVTGPRH